MEKKEAIKILKDFHDKSALFSVRTALETLYPEFKESRNEKIRKRLIEFFKDWGKTRSHCWSIYIPDILAWLEKQGESYTKKDVDDAWLKGMCDAKNELEKQYEANYQIRKDIATFIFNYRGVIKDRAKWMDYLGIKVSFVGEQGEEEPADKVEPKFKVGDWVAYHRNDSSREIIQVYDIRDGRYYFTDNVHFSWSVKECDERCHLWSIEDAKDGDILVASDGSTFIFNSLDNGGCKFHIALATDNKLVINHNLKHHWETSRAVYPATKEQCDTLIKAITDAGYTFDFEKKDLKKIVDEEYNGEDYGIDSLFHAQRILEKTLGKVEGYQTDDGVLSHQCAISAVKKLCEQKPAWSEEDEKMLADAYIMLDWYKGNNWWAAQYIKDWLKSLKERYAWKPSDEQMRVLKTFTGTISPYEPMLQTLKSLYNELKKLKGD